MSPLPFKFLSINSFQLIKPHNIIAKCLRAAIAQFEVAGCVHLRWTG